MAADAQEPGGCCLMATHRFVTLLELSQNILDLLEVLLPNFGYLNHSGAAL